MRVAAVKVAQSLQTAQHVGHVTAKNAAIGVNLVQHHKFQVRQQIAPARVVRQDAAVQHVWIGDEDAVAASHLGALAARRVAVVAINVKRQITRADEQLCFGQLVLGQRFGREDVEGTRFGAIQQTLENGHRVAQ